MAEEASKKLGFGLFPARVRFQLRVLFIGEYWIIPEVKNETVEDLVPINMLPVKTLRFATNRDAYAKALLWGNRHANLFFELAAVTNCSSVRWSVDSKLPNNSNLVHPRLRLFLVS